MTNKNKQVTKNLTKKMTVHLEAEAKTITDQIIPDVEAKLYQLIQANMWHSFGPRSSQGVAIAQRNAKRREQELDENNTEPISRKEKNLYQRTGELREKVYTKVEGNTIKLMVRDGHYGNDPTSATYSEIYDYLEEGTKVSNPPKKYFHIKNGEHVGGYNYPTPAHLFEAHTINEIKGYIDNIEDKLGNKKYHKRRR
jgi:hypothetical protein